jgi:hypothetical protein
MKSSIILISFLVLAISVKAQSDTISTDSSKKVRVSLALTHNSNLNYYGRTDSIRSSGVFPTLEVSFGKHFYVRGSAVFSYADAVSPVYNGTVAQAGYQFNNNNKWVGDLYFSKIFYRDQSTLVQSAIRSQAGFNLSFLNKYLNLNGGVDAKFSDKTDFGATGSVDHLFRVIEKQKTRLLIDPFAAVYAGSQNFSYSYKEKRGQLFDVFLPDQENKVDVKAFKVLAYEFGVPIVLVRSGFQFTVTPSYILPQNLISIKDRPELNERGSNMFYLTTGVKYNF